IAAWVRPAERPPPARARTSPTTSGPPLRTFDRARASIPTGSASWGTAMAAPGEAGIEISMAQNRFIVERDTTLSPSQRDSVLRAARASLDPARQTIPWVKFWMAYDPAPVARRVKAATLILQGATDRQVPADQAEKLAALIRAGGNRDVAVLVFQSTNHLFVEDTSGDFNAYDRLRTNRVNPAVLGALADWLAAKLEASPGLPPAAPR